MVQLVFINEASRLEAIHFLRERPVEESILHVQLVDRPLTRGCNGEDGAYGGGLDHRRERLTVVHTGALTEPADHPSCFISLERAVRPKFVFENPLASD